MEELTKKVLNHYKVALEHRRGFLYEQIKRTKLFGDDEITREHIRSLKAMIGWNTRKLKRIGKVN